MIQERIKLLNEARQPVPEMDHVILTLNGDSRQVSVSAVPFTYEDQPGALVFARDITARKLAEAELADSRRALQMLSRCNEALIRLETESDLLEEVCRIAVENGGVRLAWVGYALDDDARTIEPRASAGSGADYLADIRVSWSAQSPEGRGPAGRVIREGGLVVVSDLEKEPGFAPWRDAALARGLRGLIALPLKDSRRTFGVMILYLPEPRAPQPDEVRLLHDLAGDLAFGIGNLRMRAERQVVQQELSQQAALLEKARDAILVRDLDHRIDYWNRGAERIYGWTAAEAAGRTESELLATDPDAFQLALDATLADGEWSGDIAQVTRKGRPIVVEARWSLVRDDQGTPRSILVINTDITERRKLERQFLRAQRLDSIGTLAGGIAHDLNNVLSPILMSIELLRLDETKPARLEILDKVETITRRGADMVGQVLSFARGVEGRREKLQVAVLLGEIEKIVKDTFLKSIIITSDIPPGLHAIQGDSTQLHQVLLNLCVNARDAMPDGGRLTLSAANILLDERFAASHLDAHPGPHVVIEIVDTGIGMSPEIIDRVFEPFFTTKDVDQGTGLGLSTTLAIIKSHGGFLRVSSEPGAGSRFRVYLPALTEPAAVEPPAKSTPLPRGNGELVLIIDDELTVREIASRTLEIFGYRVLLAADGAEAAEIFAERRRDIDLVLTDMMMPVMDGPAAITALREIDPQVKIIASSGLSSDNMIARARQAGVRHLLAKPYPAESLLLLIKQVLQEPNAPT